ncbi:hypothetical protein GDO86_018194, partial [Hymenochirus boettgeri]
MPLSESPFPNPFLGFIFSLSKVLLFPSYWFVDRLLSSVVVTSVERSCCPLRLLRLLVGVPVFLLLFLISLPIGIFGLLFWAPLHHIRRPFCYQNRSQTHTPPEKITESKGSFVFISANLCLLPDGLARFSNLRHTQHRAATIGGLLDAVQSSCSPQTVKCADSPSVVSTNEIITRIETDKEKTELPGEISLVFPKDADFICLQEAFDGRASSSLRRSLAPSFPHIIYDVGPSGPYKCGFRFFNSGLFLASRHPPLAAKFYCYPNARGEDSLAAKGLLCVKVQVGMTQEQERIVGYINCTHLHAPEG